ncbi:DsbA family oxidoreductase [Alishewanella sp. SMS8]|uniref:DsbA family oxidoreductase n=1 Tax=unclassified Alishewanella TaxID=2628974 RepID=UPI0027424B62|nr:DsbA family oxidoreductase [Alishewanella sp. SMS8]MDP4944850.1 DsbA family oxidoreductase [Alishewanella sp.]MDP5034846.1 DsbA family oxidoreductase [Alishewanella sp.]MDP5186021.1 DsbA family oxidoreductase [Alishewanella sp.]MDP5457879.1 DsbA family oxidoreductase [Alishewanella sp. SMS8]
MTPLKIDLVSDIACPWCAIGYARLEQALTLAPELAVTLEWHAFELNPDKNAPQEAILPALSRKYGKSEEEMRQAQANMMQIASGLGINFSQLQQRKTCNTFDAHRLVKWADTQQKATAMKLALFDAYFGEAANVADRSVLAECAKNAGLDQTQAEQILASNDFADIVSADIAKYQQAGISSVPAFIINNKYLISGAQEPQQLAASLRQIASESIK